MREGHRPDLFVEEAIIPEPFEPRSGDFLVFFQIEIKQLYLNEC
jgi:hypothetical protein